MPRLKALARLQWPASYKAGARAWTAEQYATKVRGMAEALVAAQAAGKTVHWVRPCHITRVQWNLAQEEALCVSRNSTG